MKKIYLDYASSTPIDPRVLEVMDHHMKENFGNPMSLHSFGQESKIALEESREKVASLINSKPEEIIFTGSATESNNLALKGVSSANKKKHIITSKIEHPCVLESLNWLKKQGYKTTFLPVNKEGFVDPQNVRESITEETFLVSVIHANNEMGAIQPIKEIGEICRENNVYFHTDAAQSMGKIPIDVEKMNIDLLTGSSHKMYGPKGAACLYIKKNVNIKPILHGGGQEKGLRSSTSNVPSIVGFGESCKICKKEMNKDEKKQTKLREELIEGILNKVENSHLIGPKENRLPNNVNVRFDFIEGESVVIKLDLLGIACSTGSACSSQKLEPSHVLLSLGLEPHQAHGSLRISLGRLTKKEEIDYLIKILPGIIKKLREISPYGK